MRLTRFDVLVIRAANWIDTRPWWAVIVACLAFVALLVAVSQCVP